MLRPLKQAAKAVLETLRRQRTASRIKQSERHVTRGELTADLLKLGIAPGDTLFIHSSLKSLGYVEGGAAAVVRALQDAVGPQGTLLIPTYYMPGGTILGTCELKDYVFDARAHGTHMGRLPEAFLASPGIHRSIHPTHSVSAWGRHARHLTEAHHQAPSVFGVGSPWQRFLEIPNAKVLGLGISMGPVTFYHVLEDRMGASFPLPVRLQEECRLPCRDWQGNQIVVPVVPLDPVYMQRRIDNPARKDLQQFFWSEFERAGLLTSGKVGAATSWFIPSRAFYDHLAIMMGQGLTIYSTPEELASRVQA